MSRRGTLRRTRQAVQATSLVVFGVLLVLTRYGGQDEIAWPVRLYLDLDPLVALATLLAGGTLPVAFLAAGGVLLLSLVLGRAFCGWLCPLGALNQLFSRLPRRSASRDRALHRWHPAQRIALPVLVGLLVAAALGWNAVGILDPLSLAIRSLGLAFGPAVEWLVRGGFDALYHTGLDPVRAVSEPLYRLSKDSVLSFEQPRFQQGEWLGLLFLAILLANLALPRFWCRVLCPLGALLGLVARGGALSLSARKGCSGCGACQPRCPGGADPEKAADPEEVADPEKVRGGGWRPAHCYVCGNCTAACPQGLHFTLRKPRLLGGGEPVRGVDAPRRWLLGGAAAGAVAAPLSRISRDPERPPPLRIRPPGSRPEPEFLERCVRCGECMKVCLTGGLQPLGLEQGLAALWTPVLVPRAGYCEYNCTLCGQVCPTGAIEALSPERKRQVRIGTAFVSPRRCLPLAHGTPCVVCEEHCPVSPKAIRLVEVTSLDTTGATTRVQRPVVDPERCIGCGICEARCPVPDEPAIRVFSVGEDRDGDNRILLDIPAGPYG